MDYKSYSLFNPCRKMLSKTTKNCWRGSKYSSLITRPRFKAESMTCFMQRFAIFNRFNLSTFHWASLFDSDGADELKVRIWSFPKLSSVSSSSTPAAAILFLRHIRVVWRHIMYFIGALRQDVLTSHREIPARGSHIMWAEYEISIGSPGGK